MGYVKEAKEFEIKKGLDRLVSVETGQFITIDGSAVVTLKNGKSLEGILTFIGPSSIIVRTTEFSYSKIGVSYEQVILLIKDIKEVCEGSENNGDAKIDWNKYSQALDGWEV